MKFTDLNKNQKQAYLQIRNATNWVTGGLENAIADEGITEIPNKDRIAEEIYYTVMNCTTYEGEQIMSPIKEIRFCTKKWIMERIMKRLEKEGY